MVGTKGRMGLIKERNYAIMEAKGVEVQDGSRMSRATISVPDKEATDISFS